MNTPQSVLSKLGYSPAQIEALKNLKPNPDVIIAGVSYSEKSEVLRNLLASIKN